MGSNVFTATAGERSVQVARAGDVQSSNCTRSVLSFAWYMTSPVRQSAPSVGSPAELPTPGGGRYAWNRARSAAPVTCGLLPVLLPATAARPL
jgi:hypothetical protein